jgi:hypothetical protein
MEKSLGIMKKFIMLLSLVLGILVTSCEYQEKPKPPIPMEKVVLQEFIKDQCCEEVLFRAKRLSNNTTVSLQIKREFRSGDTLLVNPKDLKLY